MSERDLEYFSDERMMQFGESGYMYYEAQAKDSGIPSCFVDVAKAYLFNLNYLKDLQPRDVAKLLFNYDFETNRDAWIAINYAEAISIIKKAMDENDTEVDSRQMLIGVGVATMLEDSQEGDNVEAIKQKVEDIFSNPRESFRISIMYEAITLGSSNN